MSTFLGFLWWSTTTWELYVMTSHFLSKYDEQSLLEDYVWWNSPSGSNVMINQFSQKMCGDQPTCIGYMWLPVMLWWLKYGNQLHFDTNIWWSATFWRLYVVFCLLLRVLYGDQLLLQGCLWLWTTSMWSSSTFWGLIQCTTVVNSLKYVVLIILLLIMGATLKYLNCGEDSTVNKIA